MKAINKAIKGKRAILLLSSGLDSSVNLAKAIKLQELPCVFVGKVFSKVNEFTGSRINGLNNIVVGGESLRDPDSAESAFRE